jgi:ankyrin repeat protein
MPDKELPSRPNLEQYKKQAKDFVKDHGNAAPGALERIRRHHPRLHNLSDPGIKNAPFSLTDAQLIIAREYGFESWPKFAKHIETLQLIQSVSSLDDPISAFIEMACVPRTSHSSGTLEHAEMILARYPHVGSSNIHTAAILANEAGVRTFLTRDPNNATAQGGPYGWDALTHLCFSRYLRLDARRSAAFLRTACALLDAGASAKTGWYEMIDHPRPRPVLESAIYGAAGIARHVELTRLLLERGADPNDEETPYHVPETRDNAVMKVLVESGSLNEASLNTMLLRKTDWHDQDGLRFLLDHNADPNLATRWGDNALHHALRRDNCLETIELLLDRGANPAIENREGRSATAMAARRGRGDVLAMLEQRGHPLDLRGVDRLIAASAKDDREAIRSLTAAEPGLATKLVEQGGTLLAEFAGVGNVAGLRHLLDLGVSADSLYKEGDSYFGIAKNSTALHVAAWRARPDAVKELIVRGGPVNALDAKERTPLALAVKACIDSYWTNRRSPASAEALLQAGASAGGIEIPTGYDEMDIVLRQYLR